MNANVSPIPYGTLPKRSASLPALQSLMLFQMEWNANASQDFRGQISLLALRAVGDLRLIIQPIKKGMLFSSPMGQTVPGRQPKDLGWVINTCLTTLLRLKLWITNCHLAKFRLDGKVVQ